MSNFSANAVFESINIAVLTVSDTRSKKTDTSGKYLAEQVTATGHKLAEYTIQHDNIYQLRATVSNWIADSTIHTILVTGGTGITGRDVTPEALIPLFDKKIDGFGELFRQLSYQEIKASTIQSRAFAGQANNTFIFCIPGSTSACKLAWEHILRAQLDSRTRPCNFIKLLPRLNEA